MGELNNVTTIVYKDYGDSGLEVKTDGETVWLTQDQMCRLFGRDQSVIARHIGNVFKEGELERDSVYAKFAYTATDGKTYQVAYYNLDVVIAARAATASHRLWREQRQCTDQAIWQGAITQTNNRITTPLLHAEEIKQ